MKENTIYLFSEDPTIINTYKEEFEVDQLQSKHAILKLAEKEQGTLLVIDCDHPELSSTSAGLDLYRDIRRLSPDAKVILLSSSVTIPQAVEAAKMGITDFIKKPAEAKKLLDSTKLNLLKDELLQIRLMSGVGLEWLSGYGNKIRILAKGIENALNEKKNILFVTELGVDVIGLAGVVNKIANPGKKLGIIDMSKLSREGVESVLWSLIQEAILQAGSIVIKDLQLVDEMEQLNILEYIKNKAVGGELAIMVSMKELSGNSFFDDWQKIHIPSLRERRDDLVFILGAYIKAYSKKHGKTVTGIKIDALDMLASYSWPGNYRELECIIEKAVLDCTIDMLSCKDIHVNETMFFDDLHSQNETLSDFRTDLEKSVSNLFFHKTGSIEHTAAILDLLKDRLEKNIIK